MADGIGQDGPDIQVDDGPVTQVSAAPPVATTWWFALAVTTVAVVVGVASLLLGGPLLLTVCAFALAVVAAVATFTRLVGSVVPLNRPSDWFWLGLVAFLLGLAAWSFWRWHRGRKK